MGGEANHCGACIPCIIRRIAIETHGPDPTVYQRDLFGELFSNLSQTDDGRRNLADFAEFVLRFEQYSDVDVMAEWPELYSPEIVRGNVIQMYKRSCTEARKVLGKYPNLAPLLS